MDNLTYRIDWDGNESLSVGGEFIDPDKIERMKAAMRLRNTLRPTNDGGHVEWTGTAWVYYPPRAKPKPRSYYSSLTAHCPG